MSLDHLHGAVTLAPFNFKVTKYVRKDGGILTPQADYYVLFLELKVSDRETGEPRGLVFSRQFHAREPEALALRTLLHEALCHEVDECIKVNGQRVFEPHPPPAGWTVRLTRDRE